MAILAGVKIPDNERVEIALTRIYGVGTVKSKLVCKEVGIDKARRVKELSQDDLASIRASLEANNLTIEGDLKREVQMSIRRLMDIGCYRGTRHRKRLPARGQRTKTNARTRRGKKQTVAGKKQAPSH